MRSTPLPSFSRRGSICWGGCLSNDHQTLPIAISVVMSGNAKHWEKRQAGTGCRGEYVRTIDTASPYSSKTGTDPAYDMAIYQASTNDAPRNSIVTFFRTFERTGLYNFLAATPLIAWSDSSLPCSSRPSRTRWRRSTSQRWTRASSPA